MTSGPPYDVIESPNVMLFLPRPDGPRTIGLGAPWGGRDMRRFAKCFGFCHWLDW